MKKCISALLAFFLLGSLTACSNVAEKAVDVEPDISQMRAICELAVMDCYYHNVAKYREDNAEGILWWQKDRHFWIEYSGVATLGVDVSLVTIEVSGTTITVSLPEAEVLSCKVDSNSLSEASFIVAKNSASVSAEDEIAAFDAAQANLEETAASDKVLLANARQRVQTLLEEYIESLEDVANKDFNIEWKYLDSKNNIEDIHPEVDGETSTSEANDNSFSGS